MIDKILHQNLFQDLHVALGGQYLDPHTSHKEWANTYHTLRRSPNAETAISFHASYLRDLKKHCHALWPFATNDLTVTVEREEKDGHAITFPVPSITHLCNTHKNITPPVIAKAALALLVLARTNHSHAFFSNFEAARTRFPFVPDKDDPPDAMDVAGPTFNTVLNLVALHPEETVLGFLNRIQHDQANLTKYASVPWHEVFPRIDCTPDIMSKAVDSLIFNWMPGLGAMGANLEFQNMTITQVHIRTKLGMLASAGMSGDGKNMVMMLQGSLSNMSTMWIERVGEEWKRLCLWLSAEGSWYRPVGEYVEAIW